MSIRRPQLTGSEQLSVINRKVIELVDAVNALGLGTGLPDVGAGADTYGGTDGEIVESVTVDAKGRTTAVSTTKRASTTGSIFSMTGPGGADAPIVAYDFTLFDSALTVAQNLARANQSGNSAYDLTAVGGGRIDYLARSALSVPNTGQSPFGFTPLACSAEGGALFTGLQTDYVITSGAPAGVQQAGAMTVEYLGYLTEQPEQGGTTGEMYLIDCSAAGETQAANVLYQLAWDTATDVWFYRHEEGAGTDATRLFFANTVGQLADMLYVPALITLTRADDGDLCLYINGRLTGDRAAGPGGGLPDGGTTTNMSIGFGQASSKHAILGVRLFDVELTAAQVRESYQRTFFGVSV